MGNRFEIEQLSDLTYYCDPTKKHNNSQYFFYSGSLYMGIQIHQLSNK
jgi:hypothetical protein